MQVQILCIGRIKDRWIADGIAEFEKRLRPYGTVTITELAEVRIPDTARPAEEAMVKEKEGRLLQAAIRPGFTPIALDPRGTSVSSEELASKLQAATLSGTGLCFIIGGPLGLSPGILSACREKLSFSALTFTHTMCRLILIEQLYRACRIIAGEPYHK